MLAMSRVLQAGFLIVLFSSCPAVSFALDVCAGGISFSKSVKSFKDMRSESVIPQSLDYSCGPAALATLLSYYFNDLVTEQEIIKFLLLTGDVDKIKARKGFSLLDLKRFCRHRGYRVTGYKGDLDFFARLKTPVLVPVKIKDYSHFIVLRGVKGNRVFLADPALGKMSMLIPQFEAIWKEGIGLVLAKEGAHKNAGPLAVSDDEEALKADGAYLKQNLGASSIGRILKDGEF